MMSAPEDSSRPRFAGQRAHHAVDDQSDAVSDIYSTVRVN